MAILFVVATELATNAISITMPNSKFIAVAGPSGSGKTEWISQYLKESNPSSFYLAPGINQPSIDLMRIGYSFPWVQVIPDSQIPAFFAALTEEALPDSTLYLELGFHLVLDHPILSALPWHRVAVIPPQIQDSDWHSWANEIVQGNDTPPESLADNPNLWLTALNGQVFDPSSLNEALKELREGAYGQIHRFKGIFELPDGRSFYVDFLNEFSGIKYADLNLPRWIEGRPDRPSGLEVVGWNLQTEAIAQTLRDSCLADDLLRHYQQQYKANLVEGSLTV
jgi:hypothetical protein